MARRGPRQIDVVIEVLSEDGLGEAWFEDRRVLARNALPGESVTVRVLKRRRGVWYGEAETPPRRGIERQTPPCPYFPRCGGCAMQHIAYPAQVRHKADVLLHLLRQQSVAPQLVRQPVCGPQFHYRYKARLGVRLVGDEPLVGFREGFSNRVARMSDCKTLALPFARCLPALRRVLAELERPDRVPQVELAGGDRTFAIVVRHLDPLGDADRARLRSFAASSGVRLFLQSGGYETVAELAPAADRRGLSYVNPDFGLCFEFLPTDFTQVNPFMNRRLVRAAVLALAPHRGAMVNDLFCGIGNFSLALARAGLGVRGFESSPGAVARAGRNAALNGLSAQAEFALADLYDSRCPELPDARYLLLDPPRSGAGPNLERWVASRALERIVYVSCNPRTFASDAARLQSQGFTLQEVGVFDMFPHTAHVETLGCFVRRSGVSQHG
ncbi:MAG: 23S rRNA (uracil(1939)-C(5))-methyltransferase RlmD [Pseudomonadales bacterium]